jgi:hypothetical protein
MSQPIKEEELMTKGLKICENCEWCVLTENMPRCLLRSEKTGLFEYCNLFKIRTGIHISM